MTRQRKIYGLAIDAGGLLSEDGSIWPLLAPGKRVCIPSPDHPEFGNLFEEMEESYLDELEAKLIALTAR